MSKFAFILDIYIYIFFYKTAGYFFKYSFDVRFWRKENSFSSLPVELILDFWQS